MSVRKKGKDFEFKLPLFNKKNMRLLGAHLVNEYRKVTFDRSSPLMSNDQPFPKYSNEYRAAKASGKIRRSDTSYKGSTAPYLTGDLMRDLKPSMNPRIGEFSMGWTAHADKVEQLRKRGRILASNSNPISNKVLGKMQTHINKFLKGKLVNGTQHIIVKDK